MKQKIAIVVGTRPEIIKMSPVIRECQKQSVNYFIIHTGQHYSFNMNKIFFEELEIGKVKYNLEVGSGNHGKQTGLILEKTEEVFLKEKPKIVLAQGDTNSVLGASLAATKLNIKVGHIEAGLRSNCREMPEEINRIVADHISDFLFAPTNESKNNLLNEGIDKSKIYCVGNTVVDSVVQSYKIAKKKSNVINKIKLKPKEYVLMTLHRAENVDELQRFTSIINGVKMISKLFGKRLVWPIHPRTMKNITDFGIYDEVRNIKNLVLIEPVGFLDFLALEGQAKIIITDSGGVQEEACILKVPCVTIRNNTERPESVEVGANIVAGGESEEILKAFNKMLKRKSSWKNPFGDGKSAKKIVDVCKKSIKVLS